MNINSKKVYIGGNYGIYKTTFYDILETKRISAKSELQLTKVCELEEKFCSKLSKELDEEYQKLDSEKGALKIIDLDEVIKITYKVCKEIFCNK